MSEPPFIVVRVLEAKNKEVRCHVSVLAKLEKLGDDVGDLWEDMWLHLGPRNGYRSMGASFTQGMIPSIPIGGSISPKGFLLPILLVVMIIATVAVTVVVVVAVGGVPSILKLSFMVIGFLYRVVFHNLLY
ncbi:hypothetical protein Tco_0820415 [Tanacetum coccineum]|uniref:Uncharacterized protein n=1 Tax=Tanacetum coccineum TaxID=301880 RepID=A0ABQ5AA94_9ASTR